MLYFLPFIYFNNANGGNHITGAMLRKLQWIWKGGGGGGGVKYPPIALFGQRNLNPPPQIFVYKD